MSFAVRAVRLLFGIYAFLLFCITLILVLPAYFAVFTLAGSRRSPHMAHRVSRAWAGFMFAMLLIRFRPLFRDRIDPARTYVFIANHKSTIDIPAYALACGNTFRFLAKAELTRIPVMGYVIRKLYVSVRRSDKSDRSRSMDAMKKSIDAGISVFICPEGTRNRTERPLLDFRDGAFRLAIRTGTPLAILTLHGTARLHSPRRPAELRPGRIIGEWSQPIETKGMTEADLPGLKSRAYETMLAALREPGGTRGH